MFFLEHSVYAHSTDNYLLLNPNRPTRRGIPVQ